MNDRYPSCVDLTLTDIQTYLLEAVAGTVARDASPDTVRQWLSDADLQPAHQLAARQGWTGIGLPEEMGGQGGGVQDLALVAEQLGRGVVPWDQMLATCMIGPALAASGPRGSELAEAGASGETTTVLCIDARSPRIGSDGLVRVDDQLRGRVRFVLGANRADVLVVPIGAAGADEVELVEVACAAAGVYINAQPLIDGTRSVADVEFSEAPCRSLGLVPAGAVRQAISTGVVLVSADVLGASARMLEMTTSYVKERQQFGVAVGSFQAVKHTAAQMLVDVEGMRSVVQHAAWAVETDAEDVELHASVAGAFCSEAAAAVADHALFLHGAIGYTWEHDLHLFFKRAKSGAMLLGSADWHRENVCAALESWRLTAAVS